MSESWTEKFNASVEPFVQPVPAGRKRMIPGQKMFFPSARSLDQTVRAIERGTSIDRKTLREQMAIAYEADVTCPVTTAKMMQIVAEHALASLDAGASLETVAPFWRAMDPESAESKRLSCGPDFIAKLRTDEGIR